MTEVKTLEDLGLASFSGARVFVRTDFNVPIVDGRVLDETRLAAAVPTIEELRESGARLLIASHRGRPKGTPEESFSLRPVALALGQVLGQSVEFASDCVGEIARQAARDLPPGGICVLENLRFHPGEQGNSPEFAQGLAALADAYVDDAFGTAHRAHASVVGVPERLERCAAGRLLVSEVEALSKLLGDPERPFAAVVGGAKIEGKVDTLMNLLPKLDILVLGGGMANTFLAAQGHDLGRSLVERERVELAGEIMERAARQGARVLLPTEVVITDDLGEPGRVETVPVDAVPGGMMAVDIGAGFRQLVADAVAEAGTVFWNGPMGVFETSPFDAGTVAVAEALAASSGYTVVGGGETVAAVKQAGVEEAIGHVSTGGGASLELLAGRPLPGVEALRKKR